MEWVETTGKTVAEAISGALDELGVDEQDAEVVIVDEAKAGLFGIGRSDARIRARVRPAAARPKRPQRGRRQRGDRPGGERTERKTTPEVPRRSGAETGGSDRGPAANTQSSSGGSRPRRPKSGPNRDRPSAVRSGEEPSMGVDEQSEVVRKFVAGVVERFGYPAETAVRVEEEQIFIDVTGADLGLLIGPRGVTLDALQELARTVIQRRSEEHAARVTVDVAGFRAKRAEALATFARGVAVEVVSTGVAEALEPMSSSDRKIVHDTVNAIDGVVTTSEGADPRRYVVVRPSSSEGTGEA